MRDWLTYERQFGLLMGAVLFLMNAVFPDFVVKIFGQSFVNFFVTLVAVTLLSPKLLWLPTKIWMIFASRFAVAISFLLFLLIYFVFVSLFAFVLRAFGRDELKLKKNKTVSYWCNASGEDYGLEYFKRQF